MNNSGLTQLIKDEVNIKEIVFDNTIADEVELDTNITSALKEEGELRELMRKIQDLRKEKGYSPKDIVSLIIPQEYKAIADKFNSELKNATGLSGIRIGETLNIE